MPTDQNIKPKEEDSRHDVLKEILFFFTGVNCQLLHAVTIIKYGDEEKTRAIL